MKLQRIRDPLHNLIEFRNEELERTLWSVIQTRPFQRLRRVKQLGFSEFVFPGATHTRFAHSIGVFHTARQLMQTVERGLGDDNQDHHSKVALAAALVHDVGHGMFSHAFEKIGQKLDLKMARHEDVSEAIIRDDEISLVFEKAFGKGFSGQVADLLKQKAPRSLYDSIVSSQFDADRLDYMQRDRLMTGVQSSGVDATWLMANLEIGEVPSSSDNEKSVMVNTLVLGPKAYHAAENYVLSLFQLYPNVYFHKTTIAAEKLFTNLMIRLFELVREQGYKKVGLPFNHPFIRFAEEPTSLDYALELDDTVFWGALPMMAEAEDALIQHHAIALKKRHLPKCIDIRQRVEQQYPIQQDMSDENRRERVAKVRLKCKDIISGIKKLADERTPEELQVFVDDSKRNPYKRFQDSQSMLNQILIRQGDDK